MRSLLVGAAVLLVTTASGASAQVNYTATNATGPGCNDPGMAMGQSMIEDFEGAPSGLVFGGNYFIGSGTVDNFREAPCGDLTTNYFATPDIGGVGQSATIDFSTYLGMSQISTLSFFWGSVDEFNTLDILGVGGSVLRTIVGGELPGPSDGNPLALNTNQRIYLTFNGADAANFRGLRLTSSNFAFEIDDIAGSVTERVVVPEPATFSVLALGFVMLGAVRARRNRSLN